MIVVRAVPAGPAERAGIHGVDFASGALGDVITEANNKSVRRLSDLTDEIEQIGTAERIPLRQSIGDEARLYKASIDVYLKDKGVGYTHEEYDVEYRYGPVVGGVNLNGPRGDVTAAMVLLLARKQLARIKLELG